jgi:quinol monooxygenase YgiN
VRAVNIVTGYIDVDPEQRDAFVAAVGKVVSATRAEAGCEQYVFSADLDDASRFHVTEHWTDDDAMASHMASPHMAAFLGSIGGIVRGASLTKWAGATGEKLM